MSNTIIIRSVYKITRCIMEPAPDTKTGRLAKSVRRVDSNGDIVYLESDKRDDNMQYLIGENEFIEIFDGKTFDLDDPFDNAWWEAIKGSRRIAQERNERDSQGNLLIDGGSSFQYDFLKSARYGNAEFYVEYPGREAKHKINKRRRVNEATNYILNDTNQGLYTKVKILGSDMTGLPVDDVTDFLIDLADKDVEKIINLYTDNDINYLILLTDAIDKRVIQKTRGVYIYGDDTILGASQESVVMFMKMAKNKVTIDLIKSETYPALYDTPVISDLDDLEIEVVSEEAPKAPAGRRRG